MKEFQYNWIIISKYMGTYLDTYVFIYKNKAYKRSGYSILKKKIKVAVITGSRSEFGILYWLIKELEGRSEFECQLIVTGSHLAKSQGDTIVEIEKAGFPIAAKIPILLDGDSNTHIGYSMGFAVIGMTRELERLAPDIVLILGDRFEIFSAAMAAMAMNIPIGHIAGGETDWANCMDGNIRNAITKMAHIHFVSTSLYGDRIKDMGEESKRIYNVGLPSLDHIKENLMTRQQLEESMKVIFREKIFLVTYLPVGLREDESVKELKALLKALLDYREATVIFTLANADAGGRKVNEIIIEFADQYDNIYVFQSLGKRRYLSMLNICDVVIGNSSSGVIEAPSFQKGTVNIGIRQAGRIHQDSVINAASNIKDISTSIHKVLFDKNFKEKLSNLNNIFGDGTSSKQIADILEHIDYSDRNFIEKRLESREKS